MFTGIIEEVGTIRHIKQDGRSCLLTVAASYILSDIKLGDSIAVNGACLTVTDIGPDQFTADVMHETLSRSTLGRLTPGSPVNLERAMAANGRFGGHIVSGHIDGTGTITATRQDGIACWYTVQASPDILRYIVEKGSIAIDGISLTVAAVTGRDFSVSVIPHTAASTTLSLKRRGDSVNLETDLIGKYVERLLATGPGADGQSAGENAGGQTAGEHAGGRTSPDTGAAAAAASTGQSAAAGGLSMDFLIEHGF